MFVGEVIVGLIASVLMLLVFVFFAQIMFAVPGYRGTERFDSGVIPGFAVIIPAHNEEAVIKETINSVLPQLRSGDFLLVVADNCSDRTAQVSRECGATVTERKNELCKGKGFALEAGVKYLEEMAIDAEFLIFIDADCFVTTNSLLALVSKCLETRRPAQALYLMRTSPQASVIQKIAEFAWVVKNHVRPLGMSRLGLPCQLMGSGMVLPFSSVKKAQLGTSHIVEDMKLGVDLALQGHPPVFCPDAVVESYFPEEKKSIDTQRERWEHGHLSMIFSQFPGLLKKAVVKFDKDLLAIALDLLVPPLALLGTILVLFTTVLVVTVIVYGFGIFPLNILIIALFMFTASIAIAWYRFARQVVSLKELLWIPGYVLSKIPVYARYWFQRQSDWIRTNRK
jgi:cellulose synthase/poly-beta-1,6-N-acetylglucosamine synthase-like glycosyltransferase